MERRDSKPSGRTLAIGSLVAATLVIGGILGAVSARSSAGSANERADELQNEIVALELADARLDIVRSAQDALSGRYALAAGIRDDADVAETEALRQQAWADAVVELERLAERSDAHGDAAREILEVVAGVGESDDVLMDGLFWMMSAAQWPTNVIESEDPLYEEVAFADQLLANIRTEALVATVDLGGIQNVDTLHPDDMSFVLADVDFFREAPGWLGDDPTDPLADAWIDGDIEARPERVELLAELATTGNLWPIDQWVRSWARGDAGAAPVGMVDFWIEVEQGITAVRQTVDEDLAVRAEATVTASNDAEAQASSMTLLSYVAAALALVSLLGGVAFAVRHHRITTHLGTIDPLTGVRNRRGLDRVGALLKRPIHHCVVVIDLDRFKMVNDTYGHAAGDRVLVEIAERLQTAAQAMAVSSHEVIRLGGDEFFVSLHDDAPIDLDALAARLDHITVCKLEMDDGDTVPLAFSFGTAGGPGPLHLADVVDAADLAAYEAKNANRGLTAGEGPPARMRVRD